MDIQQLGRPVREHKLAGSSRMDPVRTQQTWTTQVAAREDQGPGLAEHRGA